MQPGYGCNLDEMIYEPMNISLQTYIKDLVSTAIYYYEPRIKPDDVKLTAVDEEGMILVEVEYTIRSKKTRHTLGYPFNLEEATLVQQRIFIKE